ncbi:endonuclease [Nocardia huaxiensis]|uniref:Endonuclease n=1 Tax=Nocardia huaxiensis TaxID=2755382 RepID=A0A7D6ZXF6_9NOCA|nr:LAGLIDADG family homing endonuclease [Nocardia huaxiensis]QLY30969.1 endonuclease [Nocardia huaxiensis]
MHSMRILRADTGREVAVSELAGSITQMEVWSLAARLRMVARPITLSFAGRTAFSRLRFASGLEIELPPHTQLLTVDGWVPVDSLEIESRVAVPRWIPEPTHAAEMADAEVILLAHMIGDGSCVKGQPIRYASIDEENLTAVTDAATHFGVTAIRDEYAAARVTTLRLPAPYRLARGRRNPIAAWLDELGLFGLRSYEKFVPEPVFTLPTDQVALFLRHLWATDGSIRWDERGRQAKIYYASTSLRLIRDVVQLLLRLEIHGRIKRARKPGYRDCWHLTIDGSENQQTFLEDVSAHGARGVAGEAVLLELRKMTANPNVDTVPKEVWSRVRSLLAHFAVGHREFQAAMGSRYCGSTMWKYSPSRARLAQAATILQAPDLTLLARSDIFWDRIVEISSAGEQDIYDTRVEGTHNFVAHGVLVHDSTEPAAMVRW